MKVDKKVMMNAVKSRFYLQCFQHIPTKWDRYETKLLD